MRTPLQVICKLRRLQEPELGMSLRMAVGMLAIVAPMRLLVGGGMFAAFPLVYSAIPPAL